MCVHFSNEGKIAAKGKLQMKAKKNRENKQL